jgi:quercetin dioxygenase-like cupin family protein
MAEGGTVVTGTPREPRITDQFLATAPPSGAEFRRSSAPTPPLLQPDSPAARFLLSPKAGLRLVVAGVATVGLVLVALLIVEQRPSAEPGATTGTDRIMVEGVGNVQVQMQTYVPEQSSKWHRHRGMHALAVISGTLTVYGPDCQAHRFAAGEAYVGGHGVHLARNETDRPVAMAVTYVFPSGTTLGDFVIPASPPAGCSVG